MRTGAKGVGMAAMLLAAACAPGHPPADALDDGGGSSGIAGDAEPRRVVSLNPCADAILAEIAPEQLVAVSQYSRDPASTSMDLSLARRFAVTSGSAEEVAALAPGVVVAGTFLPPATEQALIRMGFRVVKIGSITSVDDARAQVRELAALTGHAERGEAMVDDIDRALALAAAPAGSAPVPAMIWQGGGIVPGEQTLVSDLLAHTGFANFSAGRGLGQGAVVPLEDVLADPPRVLMVAGDGRMMEHPSLVALAPDTVRVPFDPTLTFCGGPTIARAAARMAQIRREALREAQAEVRR